MSKARTIALVITLTGAAFLNTLSVQTAVIVLPTIGRDLHIPAARQQWIVSAYSLASGCFLMLWGRLADVYGKRLIFILGSAWVCIVTLVCPFIPNEIGFDVFRGLQGLGSAANVPTAIGILGVTFPPGQANNYAMLQWHYKGRDAIETTIRFLPTGVCGVLTIFITSQILARVRVNYILMFGTFCVTISSLLFAVPIHDSETYWAYGFLAMCLCVFGADTLFQTLVLSNAHSLPKEDQALGGAMINAVGQVGRAIGLAIATAIQVAMQESQDRSTSSAVTGAGSLGNHAFRGGLRAADWFSVALGALAFVTVAVTFRGAGVIGKAKK
ncbi:hypothetical protein B0A55_01717 [Friedmanniomyces simplex]|uniref:Major facilitator superfamily (MFS) profile domain-containing protein n=1 Tax=Friedmanniomyces simplex TaxID=329884 RepID=A0A4U0XW46_9PEZI|nr:hypothetical protein B0A55_01717 [Friedmanniomyces simplex]